MSTLFEFYNTGDNADWNLNGADIWRCETFTPQLTHTITSVKVKVWKQGNPAGNMTVRIRATDIVTGKPTGGDLCTGVIAHAGITGTSPGAWYEITLGAGTLLTALTSYALILSSVNWNSSNYIKWRANSAAGYPRGAHYYSGDGGTTWTLATQDFMFEEWGESPDKTSSDSGSGAEAIASRDIVLAESGAGTDVSILRTGAKAGGVKFRDAVTDISADCIAGLWTLVDLSPYGVPANADFAFLRVTGGNAQVDGIAARKPGGTQAGVNTDFLPSSHAWMFAPIVNRHIEVYREHASVSVFLDGWSYGGDWQSLATPINVTPAVGDVWTTIQSNAYCPGAKAIIIEFDSGAWLWDVRPYGSSWPSGHQGCLHHGWGIVGCDSQQRWQVYANLFGGVIQLTIFVIGYITGDNCEFLIDPPDVTPAATGAYLTKDVEPQFTKAWQMSIIRVQAAMSAQDYDFRPVGSARDWRRDHDNQKWAVVKNTRGSLSFEQYAQSATQTNALMGGYGLPTAISGKNIADDLVKSNLI